MKGVSRAATLGRRRLEVAQLVSQHSDLISHEVSQILSTQADFLDLTPYPTCPAPETQERRACAAAEERFDAEPSILTAPKGELSPFSTADGVCEAPILVTAIFEIRGQIP